MAAGLKLVDYSDSEPEDDKDDVEPALPSLPDRFLDLYSSTVRTSTKDDPSLHAGRKRITPHVEGNWPAHVYLEWHPIPSQFRLLQAVLLGNIQHPDGDEAIHSLLQNDLGVALPLHVSLSRPLTLRTEQKDEFLAHLRSKISGIKVRAFSVHPRSLRWHPNEDQSRYFLVLQLFKPEEDQLSKLLSVCNSIAAEVNQPVLYARPAPVSLEDTRQTSADDAFHISIAWTHKPADGPQASVDQDGHHGWQDNLAREQILAMDIAFSSVKIRIGQNVSTVPLMPART